MCTFTLIDNNEEIPVGISHNSQNLLTKVVAASKQTQIIQGKRLIGSDLFPIIMIINQRNIKLEFNFDNESKDFTLRVGKPKPPSTEVLENNMIEYERLPLKALSDEEE